MKEKAVYKHGMHGDRNEMGKKAMSQKMNNYFPHNNIPAGDTNPNMQRNYEIIDASPVDTMGQYATRQNGGNKPYTTKTYSTTLDNDKTFTLSKSKSYTINEFGEKEYSGLGGSSTISMETGSSNIGEIAPGAFTRSKQRVPATTTYINPKGKERTARS